MRKLIPVAFASLLLIALAVAQSTRVGPLPSADSLAINQRVGRTGETITQSAGGANKERVRRGNCYYACDASGTAPGTAFGTTAFLVVYNPQNSGVMIVINKVWVTYSSGTLGAGTLFHCINNGTTQAAPSGGTLQSNQQALLGAAGASVAQVRSGATVVQPGPIAPFVYLAPELASTVTALQQNYEAFDDGLALLPGTSYQLQAEAAAGTSPKLFSGVYWEEQPLLNGQP